ncbi:MAG: hypothetical protein RIC38_07795 [Chromatocurvus sp.]
MTDATRLDDELAKRWQDMLEAVAAGEDIPPGQRWRTEGVMEALVLLGARSSDELQRAMAQAYAEALDRSLESDLGASWREDYPFPEIPFFMRRAPVHRGGGN